MTQEEKHPYIMYPPEHIMNSIKSTIEDLNNKEFLNLQEIVWQDFYGFEDEIADILNKRLEKLNKIVTEEDKLQCQRCPYNINDVNCDQDCPILRKLYIK